MTDEEMLVEILDERFESKLTKNEHDAFQGMLERMPKALTDKQRIWMRDVGVRLRIAGAVEGVRNLFSSLPEEEKRMHRAAAARIKLPWEAGGPRPLKPPGR